MANTKLWDIFCKVVDNYGDIGVCWRLAADLASRGRQVRLWVDDPRALCWMAPHAGNGRWSGVEVLSWDRAHDPPFLSGLALADVWVEGFGCDVPGPMLQCRFKETTGERPRVVDPVWINLEYLSAERYAERSHGLPSPVLYGPAAGHTRYFFFPGFSERTGGLLREPDLASRQAIFDRGSWLAEQGVAWRGERLICLFCYEPTALAQLLHHLATGPVATRLLVTTGRATAAVHQLAPAAGVSSHPRASETGNALSIDFLPPLSQLDFDHLLWCCDLNFVRGEDSLVRAIWARKPFVWQAYPQDDDVHRVKVEALLDVFEARPSWRAFHRSWNGYGGDRLATPEHAEWAQSLAPVWERLAGASDLTTRLLRFVETVRTVSAGDPEKR